MDAPSLYQRELFNLGGTNPFGEPRFILTQGNRPVRRKHGLWDDPVYPYSGCWILAEWEPPESFGPQALWPSDIPSDYPSRGAYMLVRAFEDSGVVYTLDSPALCINEIRRIVWTIMRHRGDSEITRRIKMYEFKDAQEKAKEQRIADALQDSVPAFGESASYSRQTSCNTALKQRMDAIESNYKAVQLFRKQQGAGVSQSKPRQKEIQ